jgi:MerR family mercuric resistance operon transcriptional regulator
MERLNTGELARRAGVNVETVRYYERRGLIPEPPRSESGYRRYPPATVARISFIRRAKELGFSLKEIIDLLALRVDPGTTCRDVKRKAEEKISSIDEKIEDLNKMRYALERLAASCSGSGPKSECPILEAMEASPD